MGHIQRERLPKSKMASSDNDRWTFEIVHVLRFRNRLNFNEELCCRFIFTNLQKSLRSLGKVWLEILAANLATNFQDLVAQVINLVALAPVLGAILRPDKYYKNNKCITTLYTLCTPKNVFKQFLWSRFMTCMWHDKFTYRYCNRCARNSTNIRGCTGQHRTCSRGRAWQISRSGNSPSSHNQFNFSTSLL